jgi:hypothetical protein
MTDDHDHDHEQEQEQQEQQQIITRTKPRDQNQDQDLPLARLNSGKSWSQELVPSTDNFWTVSALFQLPSLGQNFLVIVNDNDEKYFCLV